jgi:hypothetical protein
MTAMSLRRNLMFPRIILTPQLLIRVRLEKLLITNLETFFQIKEINLMVLGGVNRS